ncbi:MAG: penicillin-binding protein [Actinobacteria bacterium]|nr:penicillin-binding protein [Actinomycetota bacterium]
MVIGLAALVVLCVAGAGVGGTVLLSNCSLGKLRPIVLGQNSFLYAADGTSLGSVPSATNRQPLGLWAISPWLAKGTVAIEDRRFFHHGGVDYHAILRAAWHDLEAGHVVEGGSTITQQLVRNLYIGKPKDTLGRKIEEACLANKLAGRLNKNQILAAYLNEVFYGNHAYGAEASAQTYFSRHARELTLPQAALLAGLPQAPTVYDPFTQPQDALARRNEVLRAMLTTGAINSAQYDWAVSTPLGLHPGTLYSDIRHTNFFGYAEQQLVNLYGERRVEAGGLHVVTTIEPRLQAAALKAIASHLPHRQDPASALVAIDPRTGAIRAMQTYLPDGRTLKFNLATQSTRQAGSSFKPFVLATALNQGMSLYTYIYGPPSITIPDPKCGTNGVLWTPHNFADESAGTMNLIDATAHSVNTIYAQLVDRVGPSNVIPVAHRMGITTPLQSVCSITLGTQPVNPLEMTDAYATFAARGIHHLPQALQLVRGPRGVVLGRLEPHGERAIPQRTADLVTYVLQRVVQYGTGTAAALGNRPVAGKTGTAENFVDAWFCGYVPQLATCVWVGYPGRELPLDNVEGVSGVVGGTIPAEIWHDFMSAALAHTPVEPFVQPSSIPTSSTYAVSYSPQTTATTTTTATPPPPPPAHVDAAKIVRTQPVTTTAAPQPPRPTPTRPVAAAPKPAPVVTTTTTTTTTPTTTEAAPPPPPPATTTVAAPPPPPPPGPTGPSGAPPPDAGNGN